MQTTNIQVAPGGVKPVIHVSQFDVGRQFSLKLYDGASAYTPPTGTTIRIDGEKPDHHGFSYTENVSLSGNTVTITTTTQMTIVEGTVKCELRLTKGDDDIGTVNFDMVVEHSPINESTDMSETEVPALVTLARAQMENAEAWAVGTKDGVEVSSTEPQYHNSAKWWANQVGGLTQDSEAWAKGTRDGVPVDSSDETYHNNSKYYSEQAGTSATNASTSAGNASTSATSANTNALKAEGYAVGKQNGTDVASGSPYYHNNAEYYATQASNSASTASGAANRAEAAVVKAPYIGNNGNWFVYDFANDQYVDTQVAATGATGATGNGIASVTKTGTSGLVDTYTITYTNGTTSTFDVTNGEDGQDGATGPAGNGIVSITKTGTSGLVDTYTITYTNGTTSTFTVTNGANGTGAGDMLASDYDATSAVKNAGGIAAYVAAQISGFSTSLSGLTDVALGTLADGESLIYDANAGKWVNGNVAYSSLTGKPTLGTAAAKNVPSSGNASTTEVVMGDDTRLSDSRPASDVSPWAKAANKPSYSASEITYGANSNVSSEIQTLTQKAYQTDDATETALASDDLVPFYDTSATAKKKMSVANLIGQTVSNPNLFDNPWFTVNQRGQSSYASGYGFDRWLANSISKNNDVITFTTAAAYAMLHQHMEKGLLANGEKYTLSFLDSNGVIRSVTFTYDGESTGWVTIRVWSGQTAFYCTYQNEETYVDMAVFDSGQVNQSISFKAVKLEKGSVSTLAQDTAPNYATELLKCQRYYQRINTRQNVTFGLALAVSATLAIMPITINTMRAFPSVGEDVTGMSLKTADDATSNAITAINGYFEGDVAHGVLTFTSTSLVVGTIYKVEFANSTSYIDFSADL